MSRRVSGRWQGERVDEYKGGHMKQVLEPICNAIGCLPFHIYHGSESWVKSNVVSMFYNMKTVVVSSGPTS